MKNSKTKNSKPLRLLFEQAKENSKPLLLDGAIGSQLIAEKFPAHPVLWSSIFNLSHPDKVFSLHKKYIASGAQIITTNTFRTNPLAVTKSKIKMNGKNFVRKSVEIAADAVGEENILIAGSNAPAEDCYQTARTISYDELKNNHEKHISSLYESGADFILNETQSHFDEIKIISQFCDRNEIPYIVSLFFTERMKLLSGEKLNVIIDYLRDTNAIAISFNCISFSLLAKAKKYFSQLRNWGFYANCGGSDYNARIIRCKISPREHFEQAKMFQRFQQSFIGACCGSSPRHIRELKKNIYG